MSCQRVTLATLVLLLASACNDGPRKRPGDCGSLDAPRVPTQQGALTVVNPSLHAFRRDDGSVRILVNPILRDGVAMPALRAEDITLRIEGDVIGDFALEPITSTNRADLDVVFGIDTAESMDWAIAGVRSSVSALLAALNASGFDVAVGGIEFSDELRTRTPIGSAAVFDGWLAAVTPLGGGDLPSSALDAAYEAGASFEYRNSAARYLVLVTRGGFHERDDGTECAQKSFDEAVKQVRGEIFSTLCFVNDRGARVGIAPQIFARATGGIAAPLDSNTPSPFDPFTSAF